MIKQSYFFVLETFESVLEENFLHHYEDENLNICLKKNFKTFFDKVKSNENRAVVALDNIVTKCVYLKIPETNKAWVSPCFNLEEHD
jgi:hypothetical protein